MEGLLFLPLPSFAVPFQDSDGTTHAQGGYVSSPLDTGGTPPPSVQPVGPFHSSHPSIRPSFLSFVALSRSLI